MMYRNDRKTEAPSSAAAADVDPGAADSEHETDDSEHGKAHGADECEPAAAGSMEERHELPYTDELKRKAVHLLALVIPLAIWLAGESLALALLLGTAGLAFAADLLRVRSAPFARGIHRFFGFMMRPEECPPVGGRLVLNGATWVLISAAILVAVFPLDVAIVAFTVFMIADAAAALIGRRWGRIKWGGTTRTAEGSTAFFGVGIAVMSLFGWTPLWMTLATVAAGAAAEIPSRPLNDNIRVPLVMAAVITLCRLFAS